MPEFMGDRISKPYAVDILAILQGHHDRFRALKPNVQTLS